MNNHEDHLGSSTLTAESLAESMEGAPRTEALWTSQRGIEYRKQDGRWRRYGTPGHWNSSMTLTPLDDEILNALMVALGD